MRTRTGQPDSAGRSGAAQVWGNSSPATGGMSVAQSQHTDVIPAPRVNTEPVLIYVLPVQAAARLVVRTTWSKLVAECTRSTLQHTPNCGPPHNSTQGLTCDACPPWHADAPRHNTTDTTCTPHNNTPHAHATHTQHNSSHNTPGRPAKHHSPLHDTQEPIPPMPVTQCSAMAEYYTTQAYTWLSARADHNTHLVTKWRPHRTTLHHSTPKPTAPAPNTPSPNTALPPVACQGLAP